MTADHQPLISVLTPVHNGEPYLSECIESVLRQTYTNFEYLIINNCSTDRSLEIASDYATSDSRIRVLNNDKFVEVIENHNIAFNSISPAAKYCKIISADDFIFPDCIRQMVELAEENPSVGIVGSYQLSGSSVKWQGFKYPQAVISGREICRRVFLDGDKSFGHGSPTSLMYRTDIVRNSGDFYPNSSPHSDTSACFNTLRNSDFGFVFQVLSYERIHSETQSSKSIQLNRYSSTILNDLIQYGPYYLNKKELKLQLKLALSDYHRFLAVNLFKSREKEFWDYHKSRLEELGFPLTFFILFKAIVVKATREIMNPELLVRKIIKQYFS